MPLRNRKVPPVSLMGPITTYDFNSEASQLIITRPGITFVQSLKSFVKENPGDCILVREDDTITDYIHAKTGYHFYIRKEKPPMLSHNFIYTRTTSELNGLIEHYTKAYSASDDSAQRNHYAKAVTDLLAERTKRAASVSASAVNVTINNLPEGSKGTIVGNVAQWEPAETSGSTSNTPVSRTASVPNENFDFRTIAQRAVDSTGVSLGAGKWLLPKDSIVKVLGNEGIIVTSPVSALKRSSGPQLARYVKESPATVGREVSYSWNDFVALREELKAWPELRLTGWRSIGNNTLVTIRADIQAVVSAG